MTEQTMNDLFNEMDVIADELRRDPLHVPEDNQIAFRQSQKKRIGYIAVVGHRSSRNEHRAEK